MARTVLTSEPSRPDRTTRSRTPAARRGAGHLLRAGRPSAGLLAALAAAAILLPVSGATAQPTDSTSAGSASPELSPTDHPRILDVTARRTSSTQLDLNPEPTPVGLTFLSTDDLSMNGRRVGQTVNTCLVVGIVTSTPSAETVAGQCTTTLDLPGGQVVAQAAPELRETNQATIVFGVTGGTGIYRHASGELSVTPVSDTMSRLHLDLRK